jgi:hypothetical protein
MLLSRVGELISSQPKLRWRFIRRILPYSFAALLVGSLPFLSTRFREPSPIGPSKLAADPMTLRVLLVDNRVATSFLPEEGDVVANAIKLEQLVGTLVKERQGNSGYSEPYLASAWRVSPDQKSYTFEMRPGLLCEDGSPIDADTFKRSLARLLKARAATFEVPVFNQLLGWREFLSQGTDLRGLRSENDKKILVFEFDAPVTGLLEFLAMPQFGHYCDANYDEQGKWANPLRMVSSGPYGVESADPSQVTLAKRHDWFYPAKKAPTRVQFIDQPWPPSKVDSRQPTAILIRAPNGDERLPGFVRVSGAPLFLNALVLSPLKAGPFSNRDYRRSFASRFNQAFLKRPDPKTPSVYESSFYLGHRELKFEASLIKPPVDAPPVRILKMNSGSGLDVGHLERTVIGLLEEDGLKYELVPFERSPGFIERAFSNQEFDIRLARVDVGIAPQTWVLDMMFCSKLGISFPDPSGLVCSAVKSMRAQGVTHPSAIQMEPIFQSLEADASVIPAYHSGATWLFSGHIDLTQVSNHLIVPRVELLELK